MKLALHIVSLLLFIIDAQGNSETEEVMLSDEARLYKHLTENYNRVNPDRVLLPVFSTSETQRVTFGLALISMLDYADTTQIATFNTWERYAWNDILLKWDPVDFGGIHSIRIPIKNIWKPDIVIFNGFDPSVKLQEALAVINSDGSVLYIPRVFRKIQCSDNSTALTCNFKFGSWTFDGFRLDVDFYDGLEEVDVTDYFRNKDYKLLAHPAVRNVKYYPCCREPYPSLTFTLVYQKMANDWLLLVDKHALKILCVTTALILIVNIVTIMTIHCKRNKKYVYV